MIILPDMPISGRRLGYARVSTRDQKLDIQRDALKRAGCARIYEDHGVSGGVSERDGLDQLLDDLNEGDTVVVYKLDRLGRSVHHLSKLLIRFQINAIHLCSLSEGLNTTTPGGKCMFHMYSAFAEFQRDIILENTQAGLEAARARGIRLGRPPHVDRTLLRAARDDIAAGGISLREAATRYNLSLTTLRRYLKRVVNTGGLTD
jgi:DNA invertase Pin-like site-specific DNA recombinase